MGVGRVPLGTSVHSRAPGEMPSSLCLSAGAQRLRTPRWDLYLAQKDVSFSSACLTPSVIREPSAQSTDSLNSRLCTNLLA